MGLRVCAGILAFVWAGFGQAADANSVFSAIRHNDTAALRSLLRNRANANARGPRDTTPLMYASAYGSVESVQILLKAGADVNAKNAFDATALMWSVTEPAKVRLLLDHGADVNAKTKNGKTALLIAAFDPGSDRVVDLLLRRGADPKATAEDGSNFLLNASFGMNPREVRIALDKGIDVNSRDKFGGATALMNAAANGDVESVKLLLARGARVNDVSAPAGPLQVKNGVIQLGSLTPLMLACPYGPASIVEMLLKAGAKVDAVDARGMTPLHYAVTTHYQDPEIVRMLLNAGADPKREMSHGGDVSMWAARFRIPTVTSQLPEAKLAPLEAVSLEERTPREAARKALDLTTGVSLEFMKTGGCPSCHAQSITGFALGTAAGHGIRPDDHATGELLLATASRWQSMSDRLLVREDPEGGAEEIDYALLHLAAAGHKPDSMTDAMIVNLIAQQMPDGSLHAGGIARPPISDGDVAHTALARRAMQAFSWPGRAKDIALHVERAHQWLLKAKLVTNEDAAMKVLGLKWAGDSAVEAAARSLAASQRQDGGWAQNRYLESDAYATGQSLYALLESGVFHPEDGVIQRGVRYLLSTQHTDGSWHVRSRAPKFQPYFQSGFPYDHDQWISMMATAWAATALAEAAEPEKTAAK